MPNVVRVLRVIVKIFLRLVLLGIPTPRPTENPFSEPSTLIPMQNQ